MNKVLLLSLLALAGCAKVEPEAKTNAITNCISAAGSLVCEVRVSDGTRCVVYTTGGVDCEWRKPNEGVE